MGEIDLDELRSELEDFAPPEKTGGRSAREERIIAGFEEIQRFVEQHRRVPQHGAHRDIFERLYAVRLDRLRSLEECRTLLSPLDTSGLLAAAEVAVETEAVEDAELLAELQDVEGAPALTVLQHVRNSAEKHAAEEIANRSVCENFEEYRPVFAQVRQDLKSGLRQARPVHQMEEIRLADIKQGEFFIVGGQVAYVAEVGDDFTTGYDRLDRRLRVIYDNGTESNLLMRSFQRSLYRDEAGRLISKPDFGPLFAEPSADG